MAFGEGPFFTGRGLSQAMQAIGPWGLCPLRVSTASHLTGAAITRKILHISAPPHCVRGNTPGMSFLKLCLPTSEPAGHLAQMGHCLMLVWSGGGWQRELPHVNRCLRIADPDWPLLGDVALSERAVCECPIPSRAAGRGALTLRLMKLKSQSFFQSSYERNLIKFPNLKQF